MPGVSEGLYAQLERRGFQGRVVSVQRLSAQLPAATVQKLQRLELLDSLNTLPRNLGVFFRVGV